MNTSSLYFRSIIGFLAYIVYFSVVYDAFQLNVPRLFAPGTLVDGISDSLYYEHYIFYFITFIASVLAGSYFAGLVSEKSGGIVAVVSNLIFTLLLLYSLKDFLGGKYLGLTISLVVAVPVSIYLSYNFGKKGGEAIENNQGFFGIRRVHLLWIFIPLSFYLSSFIPIFYSAVASWAVLGSDRDPLSPVFHIFLNFEGFLADFLVFVNFAFNVGLIYLMGWMVHKTFLLLSGKFLQGRSSLIKGVFLFGTVVLGSTTWFLVVVFFYT